MNASVNNAYPQNVSIVLGKDSFYFTFYGDKIIGTDIFIYTLEDMKLLELDTVNGTMDMFTTIYAPARQIKEKARPYFYNGETLTTNIIRNIVYDGKEMVWRARLYGDVDISKNNNPTNVLASGMIREDETINEFPFSATQAQQQIENVIEPKDVEKVLWVNDINIDNLSMPLWIYVKYDGNWVKRIITKFQRGNRTDDGSDDSNAKYEYLLYLRNKFETYPEKGQEYIISNSNASSPPEALKSNQFYIAPNLNIDTNVPYNKDHRPNISTGVYTTEQQPAYYLEHNNKYFAITDYDKTTGKVTLDNASESDGIIAGEVYTIYTSFIETPYYYFQTETEPKIDTITLEQEKWYLRCSATISSDTPVKFQYWEVYDVTDSSNPILMETSEKMLLGELEYLFRATVTNHSYKVKLHVVTQSNMDVYAESDTVTITTVATSTFHRLFSLTTTENNTVKISLISNYNYTAGAFTKVLRQRYGSKVIEYIGQIKNRDNEQSDDSSNTFIYSFNDYTTGNHTKYKYYLLYYQRQSALGNPEDTMYKVLETDWIETDFYTYSLYALEEDVYQKWQYDTSTPQTDNYLFYDYMYANRRYKIKEIFRPELNVNETQSISHNLGRSTYVGYAKKPSVASWDTAYVTTNLSFQLGNTKLMPSEGATLAEAIKYQWGYTDVINGDIDYYKYFSEIVASGCPFLLKDYKGNVWLGDITKQDNKIDNAQPVAHSITVSLDFVETYPIDKVKIIGD